VARRFRRTSHGVEVRLDDVEAQVVAGMAHSVLALLADGVTDGDEVLERLFPDPYRDDPEAAAELRALIVPDLLEAKRASLETIKATLAARDKRGRLVLDDEQAEQWLTGLNDVRLTVGTRLGVTEDPEEDDPHDEDPADRPDADLQLLDVYRWLGWLQEGLVDALTESL